MHCCELVREGDMSLSAAKVAETAGVRPRAVFRRFEEWMCCIEEISAPVETEVVPMVMRHLDAIGFARAAGPIGGATGGHPPGYNVL